MAEITKAQFDELASELHASREIVNLLLVRANELEERIKDAEGTVGKYIVPLEEGAKKLEDRVAKLEAQHSEARKVGVLTPHENLVVKYVTAATVDIDADALTLFDGNGAAKRVTSVNLTVDITVSGANGRGTRINEAGIWYYIWVGDGGGTAYSWLDSSSTGANDPSASTYKGLVGMVRNNGSPNFVRFLQRGRLVAIVKGNVLSLGTATSATAIDTSGFVPPNAIAAEYEVQASTSSGTVEVTVNLSSNASGVTGVTDQRALRSLTGTSAEYYAQTGMIPMSTAQQVYYWLYGAHGRLNLLVTGFQY